MSDLQKKPVEVVIFQNPQKKRKPALPESSSSKKKDDKTESTFKVFNQKQAKYDIRKLAISAMEKKDKDKAKIDLLVELGAKPHKNRHYSIKEYKMMKQNKQTEEVKRTDLERQTGVKTSVKAARRKRHKDDLIKHLDGQTGYFKDGVQFVKKIKRLSFFSP